MNRVVLYHHFDEHDLIDEHIIYTIRKLYEFKCVIIFSSNSKLSDDECKKIAPYVNRIVLRENKGFDFAAWKHVYFTYFKDFEDECDELILMNSSVYGPIYPLQDCFDVMKDRDCDFWTLTGHLNIHGIDKHLQPYFLIVKPNLFKSEAFKNYWATIQDEYIDYWTVVIHGEIRMTTEFENAGFKSDSLVPLIEREMPSAMYMEPVVIRAVDYMVRRHKVPFIKVKALHSDPNVPFGTQRLLHSAMRLTDSTYPIELIENHQRRVSTLSSLKNLPSTLVVPNDGTKAEIKSSETKLGVFGHFFYPDLIQPVLPYLANIPIEFDLYLTTGSDKTVALIENIINEASLEKLNKLVVKKTPVNRGRDIAPWLIEFKEEQFNYDLALKLHLKKHSSQPEIFGLRWNDFMYECLMQSPNLISTVIEQFEENPELGIMFPPYPPLYNMIHPDGYSGSKKDQYYMNYWMEELRLGKFKESSQPIFSAGGMYWYRPKALERLIKHNHAYTDFPEEPFPLSCTTAHGLERVIPYIARGDGYYYKLIMPLEELIKGYSLYEDKIMSNFVSEHDHAKVHKLFLMTHAVPQPLPVEEQESNSITTVRQTVSYSVPYAFYYLAKSIQNSIETKMPAIAKYIKPLEKLGGFIFKSEINRLNGR